MAKTENKDRTRVCKYKGCKHNDKIHIDREEYIKEEKFFYHTDCYKEKKDLMYFRNLWYERISPTVVVSQLNLIINEYLEKGVTTDYLIFVLEYVVQNHLNLRYPPGFRYFVDKDEIKKAYEKTNKKIIKNSDFVATEQDFSPVFSVPNKSSGFSKILGGNKH